MPLRTTFLLWMFGFALSHPMAQDLVTLASLPDLVAESSGIEISGPNKIWTFNDSGGEPELYLVDTLGNLLRTLFVAGANNRDWEDITQDDKGNFFIGNIGNNTNANTDLTIFRIPNPDAVAADTIRAEAIAFAYEDQVAFPPPEDSLNFDCEALMWYEDRLYLASKNRTMPFDGKTHLYRLPDTPGTYVAEKIGTFDTGGSTMLNFWITAGDISPDGSKLALLSSDKIWVFYDFSGDNFFSGQNERIGLGNFSQKEAIAWVTENDLYITDEQTLPGFGGNLYAIRIEDVIVGVPHGPEPLQSLRAYPNPARDQLLLDFQLIRRDEVRLELLDASGKRIRTLLTGTYSAGQHVERIDLSMLPPGTYLLQGSVGKERIATSIVRP